MRVQQVQGYSLIEMLLVVGLLTLIAVGRKRHRTEFSDEPLGEALKT